MNLTSWLVLLLASVHAQAITEFQAGPICTPSLSPPFGFSFNIVAVQPLSLYNYTATIEYRNFDDAQAEYISATTAYDVVHICSDVGECQSINGQNFTLNIGIDIDLNDPSEGILKAHTGFISFFISRASQAPLIVSIDCEYFAQWGIEAHYTPIVNTTTTSPTTSTISGPISYNSTHYVSSTLTSASKKETTSKMMSTFVTSSVRTSSRLSETTGAEASGQPHIATGGTSSSKNVIAGVVTILFGVSTLFMIGFT